MVQKMKDKIKNIADIMRYLILNVSDEQIDTAQTIFLIISLASASGLVILDQIGYKIILGLSLFSSAYIFGLLDGIYSTRNQLGVNNEM